MIIELNEIMYKVSYTMSGKQYVPKIMLLFHRVHDYQTKKDTGLNFKHLNPQKWNMQVFSVICDGYSI